MKSILVVSLVCAGLIPAPGTATEFTVRPGKETKVVFISKAAMEKFEGKTNQMEGQIAVDPAALGDSISFRFEVDLASLDTGIPMRNGHMRDNHLETAKYPKAIFTGGVVQSPTSVRLVPGVPVKVEVEGTFTLHGVSRQLRITVETVYRPDPAPGSIVFRTEFPISLSDYGISRPQFLFLKLAEVQTVRVSGTAVGAP